MQLVNPVVTRYLGENEVTSVTYDRLRISFSTAHIDDSIMANGYDWRRDYPDAFPEDKIEAYLEHLAILQMSSSTPVDIRIQAGGKNVGDVSSILSAFRNITIEQANILFITKSIAVSLIRSKGLKLDGCAVRFGEQVLLEMDSLEFIGSTFEVDKTTFIAKNFRTTDVSFQVPKKHQLTITGARSMGATECKLVNTNVNSDGSPDEPVNLKPLVRIDNFKTTKIVTSLISAPGHRVVYSITNSLVVSVDGIKLLSDTEYTVKTRLLSVSGSSEVRITDIKFGAGIKAGEFALFFVGELKNKMSLFIGDVKIPGAILLKKTQEYNELVVSNCRVSSILSGGAANIQNFVIDGTQLDSIFTVDSPIVPELTDKYVPDFNSLKMENVLFQDKKRSIVLSGGTILLRRTEFKSKVTEIIGSITLDNSTVRSESFTMLGDSLSLYGVYMRGSNLKIKVDYADIQGSDKKYSEKEDIVITTLRGAWVNLREVFSAILT